jgi:hypothetical protein
MNKVSINQTLIKKLKQENVCPRELYHIYIAKDVPSIPSESMNKGLVFENLALDLNNDAKIPSLKTGGTPVDYVRIIRQAKRFKEEIVPQFKMNIEKKNTQIFIEHKYSDRVVLYGTLDFCSPIEDQDLGTVPVAIHDLKMTSSIYKQFGDYCWAFPYNIDHTQAYLYTYIYQKEFGWTVPFYYWVFDYSPDMNYKPIRKLVEPLHILELEEAIRVSLEKIDYFEKLGWQTEIPNEKNCKECPLKENCKSYNPKKTIEVV